MGFSNGERGSVVRALINAALTKLEGLTFGELAGKPTTLSGYGITDAQGVAQRGVAGGYAPLDASAQVPAIYMPSYVDDVLEYAAFAGLPVLGTAGKIYVVLETNRTYRWSGSTYVEISPAPGSSDVVIEGTLNLYFTPTRVLASVLTGFVAAGARAAITSGDTVLSALQKVQRYLGDLSAVALSGAFGDLAGKPTTLSGYGITDAFDLGTAQTVTGAKTFAAPVALNGLTSDPASPSSGSIWYNASAGQLKAQVAGVTQVIQPENDIPWLTPDAGEFMCTSVFSSGSLGTISPGIGGFRLFPFTARADTVITGLALNVTVAAAGSLAKFVVYDADTNGRPNALLAETADVDCASTGPKTAAATLTLRRGLTYWLGIRFNGVTTVSAWVSSATPDINGGAVSTIPRKSLLRGLSYATPAPQTWGWSSAEIVTNLPPAVWLQV